MKKFRMLGESQANAEFTFPEKYSIPFSWGQLHVTEDAHKSYGLVPLSSGEAAISGDSQAEEPPLRVDVWLTGPHELDYDRAYTPEDAIGLSGRTNVIGDKVQIAVAYDKTSDEILEVIERRLEEQHLSIPEDESPDYAEKRVHQELAHIAAAHIPGLLYPAATAIINRQVSEAVLGNAKRMFMTGLGGAIAQSTLTYLAEGQLTQVSEGISGGMLITGSVLSYRSIKRYLESQEMIRSHSALLTREYAQYVGDDIHLAYCAAHFDAKIGNLLGELNED